MPQTQMEGAMETIINVFHQYSVRLGHFDTLNPKELSQLIHKEFPNWLKEQKNPKAIEEVFKELDLNKDNQICFGEFMNYISKVSIATHEHIHKDGGDKHVPHHHDHNH